MAEVLQDLLSEDEVLDMPDETLEAFVKLFSQTLFQALVEYIDSPQANTQVVNKLEEVVGGVIVRNTFHTQIKDKGIKSTTYDNQIKNLPQRVYSNEVDVDKVIEDLTWLEGNAHKLASTLPMRTKDMYERGLRLIKEYENNPEWHHDHNISEFMTIYKDLLFFPKRNKPQETGMRSLTLNKNRWRMQLRAAEYLRHCKQNGIAFEIAREI